MDKQRTTRMSGWWALGLLLMTAGLAFGQATTVITATRDANGPTGPASAYDHQDMINDHRAQVSLREALLFANGDPAAGVPQRIKVGRRVANSVASLQGQDGGSAPWQGGQMSAASPFSAVNTDAEGGAWAWLRLGGGDADQGGVFPGGLPDWGFNWNPPVRAASDTGSGAGDDVSRVLALGDGRAYGVPHVYRQPTDNTVHNNINIDGQTIRFTNLGFNIPTGSTITGIQVLIHRRNEPAPYVTWVRDRNVTLLRAGQPSGANSAYTGNDWPKAGVGGEVAQQYPRGGINALWNTSWSPADINDPGFGFQIATAARYDGVPGSNDANYYDQFENWAIIDFVEVRVFVNPAPQAAALIRADDTQRIGVQFNAGNLVSEELHLTNWNFNQPTQLIPDDAEIYGIAARIVRSKTVGPATITDNAVRVVWTDAAGGLHYSPESRAAAAAWPVNNASGFEPAANYGNNSDVWGTTLRGADVNRPGFGLAFSGTADMDAVGWVNYAEISVWWKDPTGGTKYIANDLTITMDQAKGVYVGYPWNPFLPAIPLPAINRDNVTLNGEINGDGAPDLNISASSLATNTAPAGVLTTAVTDGWTNYGLRVGSPGPNGYRAQNVVIEGVSVGGAATLGSSAWVPGIWLANGDNIKLVNSDTSNLGIGVLTSVGLNGTEPDKAYIGSQTPGSECNVGNCVNAGIYTVGAGQTLVQRTAIYRNGTIPGGLDPASANVVLAGTGDNVLGGTASGAGNSINGESATITDIAGAGHGVTVPGSGLNTIQNNTITNHLGVGVWIMSKGDTGYPVGRTRPHPTIVGGSAPNAGNTITGNGRAPANHPAYTNYAGVWVNGTAGDDSENILNSPYRDEYNLVQGNQIGNNGGAGVFLEGPGKTRVGGVAASAENRISHNGVHGGANGIERNGIEIRSTGQHYGDRQNPLNDSDPNPVWANIIENNYITSNNHGINVAGTDNNLIGGTQAASLNAIFGNAADGVRIQGSGDTRVTSNYIGLFRDGTPGGNGVNGIEITAGATGDNQIGGSSVSERNVISNNGANGISILGSDGDIQENPTAPDDGNNFVTGNYIGLGPDGQTRMGNGVNGIAITQQAVGVNTIGGRLPGERNFIAANGQYGISIEGDATGRSNVVKGNFVGLGDGDVAGTTAPAAVGNNAGGILVNAAAAQTIGGSELGEGNFIAANNPDSQSADGIQLTGAGHHKVVGNAIGGRPAATSGWPGNPSLATDTAGFGNGGAGVFIDTASIGNITIGGTGPNDPNTIIGNGRQGINMAGTGIATVWGNRIGAGPTDAAGSSFVDLGNAAEGILISGAGANVIGGDLAHQGNIISGNGGHGINIPASGNNRIVRNKIGVDDTGQRAIANDGNGVQITGTGANVLTANTISGNAASGVYFRAGGRLVMLANFVGTNVIDDDPTMDLAAVVRTANAALPNGTHGVNLPSGHTGELVLGDGTEANGNVIGGNVRNGVHIAGGNINDIHGNVIGLCTDCAIAIPNGGDGVYVENLVKRHDATNQTTTIPNPVGGVAAWGNAIHGNTIGGNTGNGIFVRSGSTVIWANQIGIGGTAEPKLAAGNGGHGVLVDDLNLVTNRQNVTIGLPPTNLLPGGNPVPRANEGNMIGANGGDGVHLTQAGGQTGLPFPHDVVLTGNQIGNVAQNAFGNQGSGVVVERGLTGRVQIGDLSGSIETRNAISGNVGWGIQYLARYGTGNAPLIYGNHIGADVLGGMALPNQAGGVLVDVDQASRAVVIGDDPIDTVPGRGGLNYANLISGNGGPGVSFVSPVLGTVVGNYIGLGGDGLTTLGNQGEGVLVDVGATGVVNVGGDDANHALRNLFAGNGQAAAAGTPRAALTVVSGKVLSADNLYGWTEGTGRVLAGLADGGNPGGGVWFGAGTVVGSTLGIAEGSTIVGSGAAGAQPGVRLDTTYAIELAGVGVDGGFGPGYELHATEAVTLDRSRSTNNQGVGMLVTAEQTGPVSLGFSNLNGNAAGGLRSEAVAPIVVGNGEVKDNGGDGIYFADVAAGDSSLHNLELSGNQGWAVYQLGAGPLTFTASQLTANTAGGARIEGDGKADFVGLNVAANAVGVADGHGLLLAGTGGYKVRNSTITGNGGDGVRLGVAGGAAVTGASVGYGATSEWTDQSDEAGFGTPEKTNLITANGGWGLNYVNATRSVAMGNIIFDNALGGIASVELVAPEFYMNGLSKPLPNAIRVSGKAPANRRVEVFEAKDPALGVNDPTATHRGQAVKRLGATTADAEGNFVVDVPEAVFIQTNDELRLATATVVDEATGNTTAYAVNTGQVVLSSASKATITFDRPTVQAEATTTGRPSTLTLTVTDVLGNPLPGIENVSVEVASPVDHPFLRLEPIEGTGQTTSSPTTTDAGGQVKVRIWATDRINCEDVPVTFKASVNGVALDLSGQQPQPVLTVVAGNPEVAQTTLAVDPITDPTVRPIADGTDAVTLRISIHDNSASHCILSGFSRDRVRVVQISGPAGGTATIAAPAADSDANGELTVQVTATKAGEYEFGVQTDVGDDGWDDADNMPAAQNKKVTFRPGLIDAQNSSLTADKTIVLATGGKLPSGAADAANTVTLDLLVVDAQGNAPVPNVPVADIAVQGVLVGSTTPLTAADGLIITVNGPTDADGKTTATVTSTKVGQIEFSAGITRAGTLTTLNAKPVVDFRAPIDPVNSTVTVTSDTVKADGEDSTTMTITLVDGSPSQNPVAGLPASAIKVTADPAQGITIGDVTGTNAQGVATAKVTGLPAAVPTRVTLTVIIEWPPAGQPAAGVAQIAPVTLDTKPLVTFIVGDGKSITLTADKTLLRPNGRDAATLTAVLHDLAGHPVPDQTVVISVLDGRQVDVQPIGSTTTDADGQVQATATALQRNDPPAIIQAALVPAGGTPIKLAELQLTFRYPDPSASNSSTTVAADNPLVADDTSKVTVTIVLLDDAGDPIPGVDASRVTVTPVLAGTTTPADGVRISGPTGTSDAAGKLTFTATSSKAEKVEFLVKVASEDAGVADIVLPVSAAAEFLGFQIQSYSPGLHMMAVSASPRDARPQAVLSKLVDPDLATWVGSRQAYTIYNPAADQPELRMRPGRGFWLQLAEYTNLTVVGDTVPNDQPFPATSDAPLALAKGWNMVGNPWTTAWDFNLNNVEVFQNGNRVGTLASAAAKALLAPYAWRWDPAQQYLLVLDPTASASASVAGRIEPGQSFWWLAYQSGVSIRIKPTSREVGRAAEPTRAAATPQAWTVTIDAQTEGGAAQVFLGASDTRMRAVSPPDAPVESVLRMAIVDTDGRAAADVRQGPFTNRQGWDLQVTSARRGDVTLSWKGLSRSLPENHRLVLIDATNGERMIMNSRSAFTYQSDGGTRAFRVELDPHGNRNLAITGVQANASRGRAAGVPIAVTLTADARLNVAIKGLGGRVVRQLTAAGVVGTTDVGWDGRDQDGRPVPAGLYVVEVTAITDEGEMAKQIVNVTVR